jgi:hypothetical protein
MIKLIVKLLLAALIANAAWRVGSAYVTFYKFKDATSEAAQFGRAKSDDQLHDKVLELASQFDLPLAENRVTVRRENDHTYVDGSYDKVIEVVPGYRRPWPFEFHIDVLVYEPAR